MQTITQRVKNNNGTVWRVRNVAGVVKVLRHMAKWYPERLALRHRTYVPQDVSGHNANVIHKLGW